MFDVGGSNMGDRAGIFSGESMMLPTDAVGLRIVWGDV